MRRLAAGALVFASLLTGNASAKAPARPGPSWEAVKEHVAACESGGRYDARNRHSSASGRYQFLRSTWNRRGGFVSAADAPPELQEQAARELFQARGLRPWRASRGCWGRRVKT